MIPRITYARRPLPANFKATAVLVSLVMFVAVSPAFSQSDSGENQLVPFEFLQRSQELEAIHADPGSYINGILDQWRDDALARGFDWDGESRLALGAKSAHELLAIGSATTFDEVLAAAKIGPLDRGDSTEDLVFTPVDPCRVVDTRNATSGDLIGPIAANTTINFRVNTSLAAQGGDASGSCTGVPSAAGEEATAVALTVTAVPSQQGNLRAFVFGGTIPGASTLNYVPGTNIANTTIVPSCRGCGDDVSIRVAAGSSHVIADIVGFFSEPDGCPSGTAEFHGKCFETSTRTAASIFNASDACHTAGGALPGLMELRSLRSETGFGSSGDEWAEGAFNDGGAFQGMTVDGSTILNESTINLNVFRCVFTKFP